MSTAQDESLISLAAQSMIESQRKMNDIVVAALGERINERNASLYNSTQQSFVHNAMLAKKLGLPGDMTDRVAPFPGPQGNVVVMDASNRSPAPPVAPQQTVPTEPVHEPVKPPGAAEKKPLWKTILPWALIAGLSGGGGGLAGWFAGRDDKPAAVLPTEPRFGEATIRVE